MTMDSCGTCNCDSKKFQSNSFSGSPNLQLLCHCNQSIYIQLAIFFQDLAAEKDEKQPPVSPM